MMISTKGRYALRIMIDLARHREEGYISLKTIADRQETSMKYLEAIIADFKKVGIVESQRGKEGGYRLPKEPSEYTVNQILTLAEGSLAPVACLSCVEDNCNREDFCLTLPMWKQLEQLIKDYLSQVTLADLLNQTLPDPCFGCSRSKEQKGN